MCRWRSATITPSGTVSSPSGPRSVTPGVPFVSPLERTGALTPMVRQSVWASSIWVALRSGPRMRTRFSSPLGPITSRHSSQANWPGWLSIFFTVSS